MTTPRTHELHPAVRQLAAAFASAALLLVSGAAQAEYPDALTTMVADTEPGMVAETAATQMREAPGQTGSYIVSRVLLEYAEDHPEHPALANLNSLEVSLSTSAAGLSQPRPGQPLVMVSIADFGLADTQVLQPGAIRAINQRIVAEFNAMGYAGVLVEPHRDDIDPRTGRDLRPTDRSELRLVVWTGRITRLRTFGSGDRVEIEERVDNPAHARIIEQSPLQPVGAAGPGSLMRLNLIEDYVARLNRHPGRRVDVALSPAQEPGGVYLDYLVSENKPWAGYVQVSDTGTKSTGHARQRVGFMHTQLTGRDDVLQIDYYTGDLDEVSGWFGSYEAPFFASESTRFKLTGSTASYNADDFGISLANFEGDSRSAGLRFFTNIFQQGSLFVDLTYGARWDYFHNDNSLALASGRDHFFLPGIGLRAERRSDTSNFFATLDFEGNVSGIAGTDTRDLSAAGGLGRANADEDWIVARWDTSVSAFLEPLLNRSAWEDLSTPSSSTLAHEVAARFFGQYAFDNRLVPGYERVAGGMNTVRGFKQSLVAGDSVFIGSLEYRFHLPRACSVGAPVNLPGFGEFRLVPQQPGGRPDWDLIFKLFVDAGAVHTSDKQRFEDNYLLVGAGTGVELQIRRNLTFRLDGGWALNDVDRRGPAPGLPDTELAGRGDFQANFSITTLY